MNTYLKIFAFIFFILIFYCDTTYSQVDNLLNKAKNLIGQNNHGSSDADIVNGLKEALTIGSGNAVDIVSKLDGYYSNPSIKILLPDEIKSVEKTARQFGLGKQVDEFELSMNRAAESAAKEATSLFWDAIKQMTFEDAKKILAGKENEATLYFKDKTSGKLHVAFKPIINNSMESVGVTKSYQSLSTSISKLPFVNVTSTDLDEYVTNKALDGLFMMLAEEEKKIRTDPAARVTDLLKKVFGGSGG
ncbi:MAG: DUF4197 domain-containing protein [bacterium]